MDCPGAMTERVYDGGSSAYQLSFPYGEPGLYDTNVPEGCSNFQRTAMVACGMLTTPGVTASRRCACSAHMYTHRSSAHVGGYITLLDSLYMPHVVLPALPVLQ